MSEMMWAIDLDQTSLDTDKIFDETAIICEAKGYVEANVLRGARIELEATGGSFDTMGYLSKKGVSEQELEELAILLGANLEGKDFLYPDAHEFYETLDSRNYPNLSLTWGSPRTQMPKLQASGLDRRPYLITDMKKKGELIQSWRSPEGYKVVAAAGQILLARCGVLVDDKPKSFEGLPEDWTGFLVRRTAPRRSQRGDVPERVVTVPNLAAVTVSIKYAT